MNTATWAFDVPGVGMRLRPLAPEDAIRLHAGVLASVDSVGRWMDWCHPGYSLADAREWIERCQTQWSQPWGDREFGIFSLDHGALLGCTGINQINPVNRFGNLGYWIRPEAAGRGVATEAAGQVARFGLLTMGLLRLELVIRIGNQASCRLAERLGARLEGTARHRLLFGGQPQDAAMYSLLADDLMR
jgi:RimJ/RimL family protein N-acetyltransferase